MKFFYVISVFFAGSIAQVYAWSGDGKGNGGGACYDSNSGTYEMFDLYEGRVLHGLSIADQVGSTEEILEGALQKVRRQNGDAVANVLRWYVNSYRRHVKYVDAIPLIRDVTFKEAVLKAGCQYEQIGVWYDRKFWGIAGTARITVHQGRYAALKNHTHEAAFLFHEAIYKLVRMYVRTFRVSTQTSDQVREYVAQVFSDGPITIDPYKIR